MPQAGARAAISKGPADDTKSQLLDQRFLILRVPAESKTGWMFEPFYQQSAFVIDARIVRTAQALHISRAQDRARRIEKRLRQLEVILAVEESEETGPVSITLIVRVVDDGRNPPHWVAVAPG